MTHQERRSALIALLSEKPRTRREILAFLLSAFDVTVRTAQTDLQALFIQGHVEEKGGFIQLAG